VADPRFIATETRLFKVCMTTTYSAIAMHCNLRSPDAAPVLIRFNYDAHAKFEVDQPIRCNLIASFTVQLYVMQRTV